MRHLNRTKDNRTKDNRPKSTDSHPISELTKVCHSLGMSLNTLCRMVKDHHRITPSQGLPGMLDNQPVSRYACGPGQVSLAAKFPGRAPERYSGIHRVVCEVIEELTSVPPTGESLMRAVGPFNGPYRATQENWPKMFGVKIEEGEEPTKTLSEILQHMGMTYSDLAHQVQQDPNVLARTMAYGGGNPEYGCSAAIISGAAYKPDRDPGNYQSIHQVVCEAVEKITHRNYRATKKNWPKMTAKNWVRRSNAGASL